MKSKKGSLQIDFAVAAAIFITAFAFILFFLVNFFSTTSTPLNEIQVKGRSVSSILLDSPGLPTDWEDKSAVSRIGLEKEIYRIPVVVESNNNRTNWPIEVSLDFEGNANLSSVRVTNFTNSIIDSQLEKEEQEDNLIFITNLSSGDNIFYVYFSNQTINEANLTNMSFGSSSDDGCTKFTYTGINNYTVCEGNGTDSARAGLRSVNDGTTEASDGNLSIDNPYKFGDSFFSNRTFAFTAISEGPVFTRYELTEDFGGNDVSLNYTFYNNTPIWKVEINWTGDSGDGTQVVMHANDIFEQFKDNNGNIGTLSSGKSFFQAKYAIANTSGGKILATAVIGDNTYEFGWEDNGDTDIVPHINSTNTSLTSDELDIWHSFENGNISTAEDLFNQPNVTVLPTEEIDGIGIDKLNKLSANITYETAKNSLDLGQDNFFIKFENSTEEFFNFGEETNDTNIYVRSGKRLIQRQTGMIEFVTYILGVWR